MLKLEITRNKRIFDLNSQHTFYEPVVKKIKIVEML